MPRIDNSANIPQVAEGAHTLRIESAQLVDGTAYQQPDVPETKLETTFRVVTPGEEQVSFQQQLALNLGDKATLGQIARAVLRVKKLPRDGIDTDDLVGKKFDCIVGHSEGGWPKVVNGSAYATRQGGQQIATSTEVAEIPWDDTEEPPF